MKYQCEVCGCLLTDRTEMEKHERACSERHRSLLNCTGELNGLAGTAKAENFGLIVESYKDDGTPVYYAVVSAEADGRGNRCIIKTNELIVKAEQRMAAEKPAPKTKK